MSPEFRVENLLSSYFRVLTFPPNPDAAPGTKNAALQEKTYQWK